MDFLFRLGLHYNVLGLIFVVSYENSKYMDENFSDLLDLLSPTVSTLANEAKVSTKYLREIKEAEHLGRRVKLDVAKFAIMQAESIRLAAEKVLKPL